ncbi:MAG: hypothetical protein ABIZ04_07375 [Opitutus sp.]
MNRPTRIRLATALSALLFFTVAVCRAEEHPVTIKKNPPKITRQPFDPKRPPSRMPKLTPPESGVCHFEFTVDAGLGTFTDQIDPTTVEVEVDSVDMILDLEIDIWTMTAAPKKLVSHEEGHRQICERYYQGAEKIAERLGRQMIGRKARGSGPNKQKATDEAIHKLLGELNLAYMSETRVRCSAAQKRYDKITNHSLIPIPEAEAIAQTIATEPPPGAKLDDDNPPVGGGTINQPAKLSKP